MSMEISKFSVKKGEIVMPIYDSCKGKEKEMVLLNRGWTLVKKDHDNGHACVTVVVMKRGGEMAKFGYPEHEN